jgi:hypothetical protein
VDDEVDCVLTGHILFTKKPRGGALRLGEYRYKKLCAGPRRTAPPLGIVRRALNHALKASGLFGLAAVVDDHRFQVVINIIAASQPGGGGRSQVRNYPLCTLEPSIALRPRFVG